MREGEGESTLRLDGTNTRLWLSGERTEKNDAGLPLQFDFDGVLPSDVAQQDVYETVARPLVDAATAGYSACLMCYGQTGTGKTYTFGGGELLRSFGGSSSRREGSGGGSSSSSSSSKEAERNGGAPAAGASKSSGARRAAPKTTAPPGSKAAEAEANERKKERKKEQDAQSARQGVVGRALRQVLEWAAPRGHHVSIAYVQVYMELLQDLLRPESSVSLREHPELGVYVDGASWRTVENAEKACAEVFAADARRTTAFTKLNADSSRSHAVLLIAIRSSQPEPAAVTTALTERGSDVAWASARGRLFLVDLAGSERTKRSGVVGQSFDEACSINQSLTTLGRCIQALAKGGGGAKRAPVRESKLTRLLSPCLAGSTTTSLVCCLSGAYADRYETLNTLEFGRNAMRVMLKPQSQQGVDYKALTIELQAQLDARMHSVYEMESAMEARIRADYEQRIAELELSRREAVAARQITELAYDRRAEAEREAVEKAAHASAEMTRIKAMQESSAKTARASHDSRAAIIATADSLAEEVVRARRDRDEALAQLEMLTAHMSGGGVRMAEDGSVGLGVSAADAAERSLPEGASALEREVTGALAELAVFRAQTERRKVRSRAAAARIVPSSLGSGLVSARGASPDVSEARVAADRKALQAMRTNVAGLLGGIGELLASCVELGETHHPDLWQNSAEQQVLVDQIRAAHRLVHMLGRIQADFSGVDVTV